MFPHWPMPGLPLQARDIHDVVGYILSLKRLEHLTSKNSHRSEGVASLLDVLDVPIDRKCVQVGNRSA